ncbi:vitamin K epoxide reductase family protein [Tenacibaculum sp. TC6]|uniref:vitamin K epoxide reductase family protein n=1 Tax=Tenacibaculum sp. TC6 TaxID=3423223 RepID=UPI003D35A7EA
MKNSLNLLVEQLLRKNQIPFDKEELRFQIESHPSYPSLHAITGVLDHFNIENVAADVPVNKETIEQLPECYLVQIKGDKGQSLVVVQKKDTDYIIYNSEGKKKKITESEFLSLFTGIIVAVEKTDSVSSPTKSKATKTARYVGAIILTGLVTFLTLKNSNSVSNVLHLALSFLGLLISAAIVKQELGLHTSIGDAFCSGVDDKKDCDAVLTSKGAELIRGYKLSDFSILYFSILATLTFVQISSPLLSYAISLVAIPITIYSIYYQYAVVKKWCMLCLSIVGVLWLQAAIPLVTGIVVPELTLNNLMIFGLISITSWLGWSYIKPLMKEVTDLRKDKVEATKFKRNFALFEGMLNKAPFVDTTITSKEEIVLGNKQANLELVIVTNPFCGHCKPVHKQVEEILNKYNDKVKIKIRFNINPDDRESNTVKITSKLLEIYKERGEATCLVAMNEIYEEGNSAIWLKNWGECKDVDTFVDELKIEKEWCKNNGINFTPEILINGKSFPKEYNRTDLVFFIEELEESSHVTTVL